MDSKAEKEKMIKRLLGQIEGVRNQLWVILCNLQALRNGLDRGEIKIKGDGAALADKLTVKIEVIGTTYNMWPYAIYNLMHFSHKISQRDLLDYARRIRQIKNSNWFMHYLEMIPDVQNPPEHLQEDFTGWYPAPSGKDTGLCELTAIVDAVAQEIKPYVSTLVPEPEDDDEGTSVPRPKITAAFFDDDKAPWE